MFWLRLAHVLLTVWLALVSVNSEESEELNPKVLKTIKMRDERKRICLKGPSYGYCKGKRNMWNFSYRNKDCLPFTFSNCGGNQNRFYSYEACMEFCSEKHWKSPDIYDILEDGY
uniref:GA30092 n=1 Tax=Drosophila pseudoobscura pseudoobscura TaxID=46245 RepID=A0A411KZI5_DROPS|nr:GA30092 [Drosophila pseudoobscura pseudoobscura]